jgi:sarcosine oxidase subunit alpha
VSNSFRTASGGRIDRTRPLFFSLDGRVMTGFAGDTLASALIANGVHLVARSFKYHRPRGILSAGSEEPNALVHIDRGGGRSTPNLRATQVELFEGLCARSQNRWPLLSFDLGATADLFAPLFPAGFYYKTLMGPRLLGVSTWARLFEPMIRRSAGMGRAPIAPDPDRYANRFAHCDVRVVGAGPAGLAAALAAAETGACVLICDEQAEFGGSLLGEAATRVEDKNADEWLADALAVLGANDNVMLLPRTQAFGYFADNFVALAQCVTDHLPPPGDPVLPRERLWQVRAKEVVLATGAIERPLVFGNNDRPGIMLANSARTYVTRYGARAGTRALVVTAHDSAYAAATELVRAGAEIALIADLRLDPGEEAVAQAGRNGIRVEPGTAVLDTAGRLRVREVTIGPVVGGAGSRASERFAVDLVLMSGGWTPSVHLFSQSRGTLKFMSSLGAYVPDKSAQRERSAGACRGVFALSQVVEDGYCAGAQAAQAAGFRCAREIGKVAIRSQASDPSALVAPSTARKAFVDFQNDVTVQDFVFATREGFRSMEHVKRYTTSGMGTDQGKTSNVNALSIVASEQGKSIVDVGFTTFRMPYTPVSFGTLAGMSRGSLFDPVRTTPMHEWAVEHGAAFENVGVWKRAHYFPRQSEDMHAAVRRECRTARASIGIFDASTLGKIEIVGSDAAQFLDRIYVNALSTLAPGRCRYAIMLNEAGFVFDDGVVGRLAPDRFHITTTTGGAARVLAHMEDYLQTEWGDLDAWLTSVTDEWAVIAVQGPRAREAIAPFVSGIALDALPHMSVRQASICGVECRLFRVSFTGELGFEINVPADYGCAVWEVLFRAVEQLGGCAYGTETMHALRAEKGYIVVGQDTDGTVTLGDLGLDWVVGKAKRDFIGKRSLTLAELARSGRQQLVGLLTPDRTTQLEEGAAITESPKPPAGKPALGHVTSSYWSESQGRPIALGLVQNGRGRIGKRLYVATPGGAVAVDLVGPVFFDPAGARLRA